MWKTPLNTLCAAALVVFGVFQFAPQAKADERLRLGENDIFQDGNVYNGYSGARVRGEINGVRFDHRRSGTAGWVMNEPGGDPEKTYGKWSVECVRDLMTDGKYCEIVLIREKLGEMFSAFRIERGTVCIADHGQPDENAMLRFDRRQSRTSNSDGCFDDSASERIIDQLTQADTIKVRFYDRRWKEPVNLTAPAYGASVALKMADWMKRVGE